MGGVFSVLPEHSHLTERQIYEMVFTLAIIFPTFFQLCQLYVDDECKYKMMTSKRLVKPSEPQPTKEPYALPQSFK